MYRHFEIVVLQCVDLDFVYDLVLKLRYLLLLSFWNFMVLVIMDGCDLNLVVAVL